LFRLFQTRKKKEREIKLSHLRGGQSARRSIYTGHLYIPPDTWEAEFLSLCGRVTQNAIYKQGVRSFSRTIPDQTGAGPEPRPGQKGKQNNRNAPTAAALDREEYYENIHILPNDP